MTGKPTVIVVGADKGGVGKTMTCRVLLEYLQARSVAFRAFDTESPNGGLARFGYKADIIDIGRVHDQMRVFDGVTADCLTVLDIRAGLLSPTLAALDSAMLLDDVRSGAMRLVLLHALGPSVESISEIASVGRALEGADVLHLLVKNYISKDQFSDWDANPKVRTIFAPFDDRTITVPFLIPEIGEALQRRAMEGQDASFCNLIKTGESRMLLGLSKKWLKEVWAGFERVKLLN